MDMLKDYKTFDDFLLIPQYSDIRSRKEIDISTKLGENNFDIPIISSPMTTVTEIDMSLKMSNLGGFGIIHRYCSIRKQIDILNSIKQKDKNTFVGAAIGTVGDFKERTHELIKNGVNLVCIDVAHGHHILVKEAIEWVKKTFENVHLMAGNVASGEGFRDLSLWGADSIRVGVGGGSICSTRIQTGHGVPTLSSIFESFKFKKQFNLSSNIIADGGIKNSGDIVKALAAGSDMVILGSLLAGTSESPSELFQINGEKFKMYSGMASKESQESWRGYSTSIEGVSSKTKYVGPLENVISEFVANIKSGLSYSGVRTIKELQESAIWSLHSNNSLNESKPHILSRI
jgi:IMP dehydrogenase